MILTSVFACVIDMFQAQLVGVLVALFYRWDDKASQVNTLCSGFKPKSLCGGFSCFPTGSYARLGTGEFEIYMKWKKYLCAPASHISL